MPNNSNKPHSNDFVEGVVADLPSGSYGYSNPNNLRLRNIRQDNDRGA